MVPSRPPSSSTPSRSTPPSSHILESAFIRRPSQCKPHLKAPTAPNNPHHSAALCDAFGVPCPHDKLFFASCSSQRLRTRPRARRVPTRISARSPAYLPKLLLFSTNTRQDVHWNIGNTGVQFIGTASDNLKSMVSSPEYSGNWHQLHASDQK
eukprot:COSAG02_NODE_60_length_43475_cov_59.494582_16_plen_153_part_00